MKRKNVSKQSGITLIALIITILVLLILATVSVKVLTGEDGILARTLQAKEVTIIEQEKEVIKLAWNSLKVANQVEGTTINADNFEQKLIENKAKNVEVGYEEDNENNNFLVNFTKTHHQYTVDGNGNISSVENSIIEEDVEPTETIYVTLYNDGTLAFSNNSSTDTSKVVTNTYSIAKNDIFETEDDIPWKNERTQIQYVDFVNIVAPTNTARWFQGCENLLELKHMQNLNTSNVTSMLRMFNVCSKLENINMRYFNTKNVTNYYAMFASCTKLRNLDLTSFNTENATDMTSIFHTCSNFINIYL